MQLYRHGEFSFPPYKYYSRIDPSSTADHLYLLARVVVEKPNTKSHRRPSFPLSRRRDVGKNDYIIRYTYILPAYIPRDEGYGKIEGESLPSRDL